MDVFEYFRTDILLIIHCFLQDSDVSSFSSASRAVASSIDLYLRLFNVRFGKKLTNGCSPSGRVTRSQANPRRSYFRHLRELRRNWKFLFYFLSRADRADSPKELIWHMMRLNYDIPNEVNRHMIAYEGSCLLCAACRFQKWRCVRLLAAAPTSHTIGSRLRCHDCNGMTPLIQAAWSGHIKEVKWILSEARPKSLLSSSSSSSPHRTRLPTDQDHSYAIFLRREGDPHMTSACGGSGTRRSALEWTRRKSSVCGQPFPVIVRLLERELAGFPMPPLPS